MCSSEEKHFITLGIESTGKKTKLGKSCGTAGVIVSGGVIALAEIIRTQSYEFFIPTCLGILGLIGLPTATKLINSYFNDLNRRRGQK